MQRERSAVGRRPMCSVCLLLVLALCLADLLGISFIRGNPLPESLAAWIAGHPEAVVCGEVQQCVETENSHSIYLKNVFLLLQSEETEQSESSGQSVFQQKNSIKNPQKISIKNSRKISIKNLQKISVKNPQKVSIENVRVFLKKEGAMENIPAGTLLKVSGRLVRVPETRNPGEFDSRQYYACRHIYYYLKDARIMQRSETYSRYRQGLLDVRGRLAQILEKTAGTDAPVFEAMLLGEKSGLEEETKLRYQMVGIIHILAISGMHISLLGEGLNRLLKNLGLGIFLSGMLSLGVMVQYGLMTGGSIAAMRAVCMFLMAVGAQLLGRCYDSLNALGLSALILLLSAPANLYDSGFLLSFGAVLGIRTGAVFAKALGIQNRIAETLVSSAAVQLAVLPVTLWFYGETSVLGIFLNLLVLPTVGAVLASGAAGAILGLFSLKAAGAVLLPGRALLFLYDQCCILAGKLPFCTWVGGRPRLWQAGLYYACYLAALFAAYKALDSRDRDDARKKKNGRRRAAGVLCGFLLCTGILLLGWRGRKGLTITCLDVGQGDAIVLETGEGDCFLVDGVCYFLLYGG